MSGGATMFAMNEKSEPAFSESWDSRLLLVNVVRSRFIGSGDEQFFRKLIANKEFIILHVVCSGWGGSRIEPGVPDTEATYAGVKKIISMGFPVSQMVLSISPLFINNNGLKRATEVLDRFRDTGISRVLYERFSLNPKSRAQFMQRFNTVPKSTEVDVRAYFDDYGFYRFEEERLCRTDLCLLGYSDSFNKELAPISELITDAGKCKGGCIYCEACNSYHKL